MIKLYFFNCEDISTKAESHICRCYSITNNQDIQEKERKGGAYARALCVVCWVDCPVDLKQVRVRIIIMSKVSHLQVGPVKPGIRLPFTLTVFMDRASCWGCLAGSNYTPAQNWYFLVLFKPNEITAFWCNLTKHLISNTFITVISSSNIVMITFT